MSSLKPPDLDEYMRFYNAQIVKAVEGKQTLAQVSEKLKKYRRELVEKREALLLKTADQGDGGAETKKEREPWQTTYCLT